MEVNRMTVMDRSDPSDEEIEKVRKVLYEPGDKDCKDAKAVRAVDNFFKRKASSHGITILEAQRLYFVLKVCDESTTFTKELEDQFAVAKDGGVSGSERTRSAKIREAKRKLERAKELLLEAGADFVFVVIDKCGTIPVRESSPRLSALKSEVARRALDEVAGQRKYTRQDLVHVFKAKMKGADPSWDSVPWDQVLKGSIDISLVWRLHPPPKSGNYDFLSIKTDIRGYGSAQIQLLCEREADYAFKVTPKSAASVSHSASLVAPTDLPQPKRKKVNMDLKTVILPSPARMHMPVIPLVNSPRPPAVSALLARPIRPQAFSPIACPPARLPVCNVQSQAIAYRPVAPAVNPRIIRHNFPSLRKN